RRRLWLTVFGALLVFACALTTTFAFLPAAEDVPIPLAQQGGGARQTDDSLTGLQAPWPELEPVDADLAALGRLLFYDPVLSANDDLSCASCHHPDLGFADGRALAAGSHGADLRRNAPTLWN